jgi:5'-hydroxyaverantin dehydrogenase
VTIADLNQDAGIALVKELTDKGLQYVYEITQSKQFGLCESTQWTNVFDSNWYNSAQFVKCDVTSWDDITNAFKLALGFSPDKTVDIVMPNAGIATAGLQYWLNNTEYDSSKPESDTPPPPPQKVIDINYHAVFNTVHAAIWYFKNFPGTDLSYSKNLVFVSSMAGYNHMPGSVCYNSAKFGVRGIFWSLRNIDNLLGDGKPKFRANLIAPTYINTNMTRGLKERVKETTSPIRVAEVSDVVHVVMRMVSDESVKGMCQLFCLV